MLKEGGSEKPSIPLAIWNMNPSFILVFLGVPSSTLMARRGGGRGGGAGHKANNNLVPFERTFSLFIAFIAGRTFSSSRRHIAAFCTPKDARISF
jgi:hypothetical protein